MSSDLWKVENVYYPPTIRETALSSSEARDAPEEAKAARLEARSEERRVGKECRP